MVEFTNYGQKRELDANEDELIIIEKLLDVCDRLEPCRKSDSYLTAAIGETDVARFKYTKRAKWIQFPYTVGKIPLKSVDDIANLRETILEAVTVAERING